LPFFHAKFYGKQLFLDDESAKWQYFPTPSVSISRVKASTTDRSYFGDDKVIKLGLNQTLWAGGSDKNCLIKIPKNT
jgi:hypothetical protein